MTTYKAFVNFEFCNNNHIKLFATQAYINFDVHIVIESFKKRESWEIVFLFFAETNSK